MQVCACGTLSYDSSTSYASYTYGGARVLHQATHRAGVFGAMCKSCIITSAPLRCTGGAIIYRTGHVRAVHNVGRGPHSSAQRLYKGTCVCIHRERHAGTRCMGSGVCVAFQRLRCMARIWVCRPTHAIDARVGRAPPQRIVVPRSVADPCLPTRKGLHARERRTRPGTRVHRNATEPRP